MLAVTATFSLLFTMGVTVARVSAEPHERTVTEPEALSGESSSGSLTVGMYRGHNAAFWAERFRGMRRLAYVRHKRIRQLKRTLMSSPSVSEAINLAGAVYGNGSLLWQLAWCESTLDPRAQNPSGSSGLLQFMPSTFAATPYGRFSIWSPYASALAGGWMLAHGRRGEWVC